MQFAFPLILTAAVAGVLSGCNSPELPITTTPIQRCTPELLMDHSSTETVEGAQQSAIPSRRFIVKTRKKETLEGTASMSQPLSALSRGENSKVDRINSRFYSVEFDREMSSSEVADRLNSADYEYIEPDFEVHHTMMPNDTKIASQWAHGVVQSAQAWDITRGSRNIVVAVIDSGIDYTHPDLAANVWVNLADPVNGVDDDRNGYVDDIRGWNFANNNNIKADDASSYHGTHVSGTIGAVGNNGLGISGQAQLVQLMGVKFLSSGGSGFTSNAIRGIDYAIANGAHIISNSWGSTNRSQALSDAIGRARAASRVFLRTRKGASSRAT